MYPVTLGYQNAIERINNLTANENHAEALVTSVFTAEKTLRRTLRQLIVSAGFRSQIADKIIHSLRGLDALKDAWELYDPKHRKLINLLALTDWKALQDAAKMRNKLVHGERVYSLSDCQQNTTIVIAALSNVKSRLDSEYGYSGWTVATARHTSKLHIDPRVKVSP